LLGGLGCVLSICFFETHTGAHTEAHLVPSGLLAGWQYEAIPHRQVFCPEHTGKHPFIAAVSTYTSIKQSLQLLVANSHATNAKLDVALCELKDMKVCVIQEESD
jgi:hypothetical protein